jgi:hypothetical protein
MVIFPFSSILRLCQRRKRLSVPILSTTKNYLKTVNSANGIDSDYWSVLSLAPYYDSVNNRCAISLIKFSSVWWCPEVKIDIGRSTSRIRLSWLIWSRIRWVLVLIQSSLPSWQDASQYNFLHPPKMGQRPDYNHFPSLKTVYDWILWGFRNTSGSNGQKGTYKRSTNLSLN